LFCALTSGRLDLAPEFADLGGSPAGTTPELWIHGTGPRSAALAARLGMSLGTSLFHHFSVDDPSHVRRYRDEFRPRAEGDAPRAVVGVAGVCAPTAEAARAIESGFTNSFIKPTVVGDPRQCAEQLHAIADRYDVDEVLFLGTCDRLEDRVACYELLAEALGVRADADGSG